MTLDLDAMRDLALDAARAAGAILTQHFGALRSVRSKAPGDWVSDADLQSELAVREILGQGSGIPVHCEEEGGDRADVEWLVDPLDGTANFLHGFDAVGVSIALVEHGEPVAAVVHAPFLANGSGGGRMYTATKGGGAFRDGKQIAVSTRVPEEAIVATGFPFRRKHLLDAYLATLVPVFHRFEDVRRVGAASLDLCWVAEGVFDGYFELGLGPWDVAAGALVVREAGGVVTDWGGGRSDWLVTGDIVAASPPVHAALAGLVQTVSRND
jgi:myo-inositol-1(or 4)-monophosphatase